MLSRAVFYQPSPVYPRRSMSSSAPPEPRAGVSPRPLELFGGWVRPPLVAVEVGFHERLDPLDPAEAGAVVRAGEKRRTEFRAGRHCARRALAALGLPPVGIPQSSSRMPCWPADVVGSISHSGNLDWGHAVAVLGRSSAVRAVGVDIERERVLEPDLWERVLTAEEQRFVASLPVDEREHTALVMFCAKECVYKCQYPLLGVPLEFHEVSIALDRAVQTFGIRSSNPGVHALLASGACEGRYRRVDGWLACLITVAP
jgi:4'-phosphopantetheinyl transferase EntD